MRQFEDEQGRGWTVGVGRESYGNQVLVFFPAAGGGVMKAPMAASTWLDAEQELARHSAAALREELAHATPWEDDSGLPGGGPNTGP